jgi:hypothetical protein
MARQDEACTKNGSANNLGTEINSYAISADYLFKGGSVRSGLEGHLERTAIDRSCITIVQIGSHSDSGDACLWRKADRKHSARRPRRWPKGRGAPAGPGLTRRDRVNPLMPRLA